MSQARRAAELIVRCNDMACVAGRAPIFKPTTRLIHACSSLPFIAVQDASTLGDFVDCLFWALYEGAGANKLRFLDVGLLQLAECDVVFHVKHLRNKFVRHDPEHGSDEDIRARFGGVRSTLQALGLQNLPAAPEQYRALQERLIAAVVRFLERLEAVLAGIP